MAVKTITVTIEAYEALKSLKAQRESFSDTILRVAKRKPLSAFFGVLGKDTGERLEKAVMEMRRKRNAGHQMRLKEISSALKG